MIVAWRAQGDEPYEHICKQPQQQQEEKEEEEQVKDSVQERTFKIWHGEHHGEVRHRRAREPIIHR